jgi:hypothetical protein
MSKEDKDTGEKEKLLEIELNKWKEHLNRSYRKVHIFSSPENKELVARDIVSKLSTIFQEDPSKGGKGYRAAYILAETLPKRLSTRVNLLIHTNKLLHRRIEESIPKQ